MSEKFKEISNLRLIFRRSYELNGFCLWIGDLDKETFETRFAKPIKLEFDDKCPDGFFLPEPTLTFKSKNVLQAFEDLIMQLEVEGFKVTKENIDSDKARLDHIGDLRDIVFSLIQTKQSE